MTYFHNIDPVAIHMVVPIRWYGLSYLLGYLIVMYASPVILRSFYTLNRSKWYDFVTSAMVAGIIGGRVGYILGYELTHFLNDPLVVFKLWQGGMSIHGGILGFSLYTLYASRGHLSHFLTLTDVVSIMAPAGLFLGRVANFVNSELLGVPTDGSWGVVFTRVDTLSRHPVQLYEATMEGICIGLLMLLLLQLRKHTKVGTLTISFVIAYACARIFCEIWRIPHGSNNFGSIVLSNGQLYSCYMLLCALILIVLRRYFLKHAHLDMNSHIQIKR